MPRDLEIWWMTLKNNRAPLLYYIKLCAALESHWHNQTGVTVWKRSIRVNIGGFLSRVTLKIDLWPWKTIGHLFYTTPIFVHHFNSIGEVKLELQPSRVKLGEFFVPHDLKNWRMTWINNRAPLLCCCNSYASFHSQWWIQTGVTVQKRPISVKIDDFLAVWPWNLTDDLEEK